MEKAETMNMQAASAPQSNAESLGGENPRPAPAKTTKEELVIMKTIYWKGTDGGYYCTYVTQDGRIIKVETLDRWPFTEIGEE